jgi:GNAT superfamily N-acetyltransferase
MVFSLADKVLKETADFMKFFGGSVYTPTKNKSFYFSWKLRDNPFFKGYIYIERDDQKVVGLMTVTPKQVLAYGQIILAAEIGEALTHPDFRRKGIFTKASKACTDYAISQGCEIIYGTPNRFSLAGLKKLGYTVYPYSNIVQLQKCIIGIKQLALYAKQQPEGRLKALLNLFDSIYRQSVAYVKFKKNNHHQIKIKKIDQINFEIDGLWGKDRADFGFFTYRDPKYLNWRFHLNPDEYKIFIAQCADRSIGYMVTKITIDHGFKVATICDFIVVKDDSVVFCYLLQYCEKYFKGKGVRHIRVWCMRNSPYFQFLVSFGYTVGRERPVIIYSETETGKKILSNNAPWHFTIADCDHI